MAERENLMERNGKWWREYCSGRTLEYLAARDGVAVSTISTAIGKVRDSIPEVTREQEIQRSLEMLHELRAGAVEVYEMAPAPVFVGKDGTPAIDPETGQLVRDHTGRLRALESAVKVDESIRKLLGLDAAKAVDVNLTSEVERARQLAEEAAARLAGDES